MLNGFNTTLFQILENLKMNKRKDFIDLAWMQQIMELFFTINTDMRSLVVDLWFPREKWDKKWIEQYVDDTVNQFDICIALNVEIPCLDQCHLIV